MIPALLRIAAAAVRIIPASVIVAFAGYVGLDWVARNWMGDPDPKIVDEEKRKRGLDGTE